MNKSKVHRPTPTVSVCNSSDSWKNPRRHFAKWCSNWGLHINAHQWTHYAYV